MGSQGIRTGTTQVATRLSRPGDAEALLAARWRDLGAYALQRAYGGEPEAFWSDAPEHPSLSQLATEIYHPFDDLLAATRYQLGLEIPTLAPVRGGLPTAMEPAERLGRQLGLMEGVLDHPPWRSQLRCLAGSAQDADADALRERGCRHPALDALITGYHQDMDTALPHRAQDPRAAARKRVVRALAGLRVEAHAGRRAAHMLVADLQGRVADLEPMLLEELGWALEQRTEPVRSAAELAELMAQVFDELDTGRPDPAATRGGAPKAHAWLERKRDRLIEQLRGLCEALGEPLVVQRCDGGGSTEQGPGPGGICVLLLRMPSACEEPPPPSPGAERWAQHVLQVPGLSSERRVLLLPGRGGRPQAGPGGLGTNPSEKRSS